MHKFLSKQRTLTRAHKLMHGWYRKMMAGLPLPLRHADPSLKPGRHQRQAARCAAGGVTR
ncbi:hypothetical protein CPter291_3338 [Collimonas pratensis]|uniref:Uncharacterized protein n=1 Tax=Collimonas pratensis TaxID=279113 RepID=A0ABN4MBF5_9BURK|nr:hypothetical protein CPter291_3338 [Collimonas pratensis]